MTNPTFNGSQVFGDGPARFIEERFGRAFRNPLSGSGSDNLIFDEGKRELRVTQRGRFVESTEAVLRGRIDQVRALAEAPAIGLLRASSVRSWSDMTMLIVDLDEKIDGGREWSVGYTIQYARLEGP